MASTQASTPSPQRLKFRKTLVKDSKLTVSELIKRLTSLLDELKAFDQDVADRDSLSTIRSELTQPTLILHKDQTVKALVACCIANLLRLYAPDAPYTLPELRDIFQFFFRQIRNLQPAPSQSPNQALYLHLLESLAGVQSIVLVCDVPQSDELINEIFRVLFRVVSTGLSQNFLLLFADLCVQIINGAAPIIPPTVVRLLLDQFKPKQLKSNPAAYRLAIDIGNACEDRLKQEVCRYFNDLLTHSSKAAGFDHYDSDDSDNVLSNDDQDTGKCLTELEATHDLIISVYQVCPGLLQSVVPQLEAQMKKSQIPLRLLAVKTLGQMFAVGSMSNAQTFKNPPGSNGVSSNQPPFYTLQPLGTDLARKYSNTWKEWIRRSFDISPQIRLAVVSCLKPIISKQPHLNNDISMLFKAFLSDPDEKVRCECCKVFSQLNFELILHHIDTSVLRSLSGRLEDRKASVQREALGSLGRLYKLAYSSIEAEDPQSITQFSWIPQEFLTSMFVGDARLCASAEKLFLDFITPFPSSTADEVKWVDRLITIAKYLDHKSIKKLRKFSRLGIRRPTGFDRFLDGCEQYNGGVINENENEIKTRLAQIIRHIASHFPDPAKAVEDLHNLAKMNDRRIYKLLKTMSDEKADLSTLIKTHQEFHRKIKPLSPSMIETLEIFLHKSAYLIINSATVPILLEKVRTSTADETVPESQEISIDSPCSTLNSAKTLFDMIAIDRPTMLKVHIEAIIESLTSVAKPGANEALADICLLALSSIAKDDARIIPINSHIADSIKYFATNGTRIRAKLAACLLAKVPFMEEVCREVNETLVASLTKSPPEKVVSCLSALSQIVKYAPKIFETHVVTVTTFIIRNQIISSSVGDQEGDDYWIPDNELCDSSRARIEGFKVLINRCIAHAKSPDAKTLSAPVFKLLWQLIELDEKIGPASHSYAVSSRFRLKAAQSALKLASYPSFSNEVHEHFGKLVTFAQDQSYYARERFYNKLVKYLHMRKLSHPRFNVILFLTPLDPVEEIKQMAMASINSRLSIVRPSMRTAMFETVIVYLLHALSHHDDFGTGISDLEHFAIYVEFFVETVGNSENASLIYHLAGQLKTVKDAQSHEHPEYLYILSELAQLVVKAKAQERHWVLPTYPGHVDLPKDLFEPLSSDEASQVRKKDYLPEEFIQKFSLSKIYAAIKQRKAKNTEGDEPEPPHRSKNSLKSTGAKKWTQGKKKRKVQSVDIDESDKDEVDHNFESKIKVQAKRRLLRRKSEPIDIDESDKDEVDHNFEPKIKVQIKHRLLRRKPIDKRQLSDETNPKTPLEKIDIDSETVDEEEKSE